MWTAPNRNRSGPYSIQRRPHTNRSRPHRIQPGPNSIRRRPHRIRRAPPINRSGPNRIRTGQHTIRHRPNRIGAKECVWALRLQRSGAASALCRSERPRLAAAWSIRTGRSPHHITWHLLRGVGTDDRNAWRFDCACARTSINAGIAHPVGVACNDDGDGV